MSKRDKSRKWIWIFLGTIAAMQLYFVRELLAAFAIFLLGFSVIALAISSLYLAQKTWEAGVGRLAACQHPVMLAVRRGVAAVVALGRRPIRRPGSQTAS